MKKTILLSLLLALFSLSACNSPNENTSQANNLENYPELEYSFSSIYCDDVSKEARSLSYACYKIATSNTIPAKGIKSKTGARGEEIILVEDIEEMFSDMEFNSLTPEEVIIEGRISESIAFEGILNSFRCSAKMNNLVLSSMYINSQLWWISKFYLDSYDEWTIDDAVIQVKGVLEKNGDENNCQYSMSSCSVYRVISVPNKLITQEYETWSAQGYEILDKWGYPFPKEEIAICGSSNCISVYDETAELLPSFSDTYTITNTAYFKVNVTSNDSFVYRLFGEGEVECVYVQNSIENCIMIKKDDLFFSCLNCGWSIEYGEEFGPYKRFKGFYLIKEEYVREDVFVVNVDLKEESPNDPIVSFGDYVADSFKWREVNKSYTWDELLDLSKK